LRWFWIFFLVFAACFLESTFLHRVALNGARPELVFLLAMFACLHAPRDDALTFAVFAGFAKDACSVGVSGANAIAFFICAYMVYTLRKKLFRQHPISDLIMMFAAVCLYNALQFFALFLYYPAMGAGLGASLRRFVDSVLYTSLLAPPLFYALRLARGHYSPRAVMAQTFIRKD